MAGGSLHAVVIPDLLPWTVFSLCYIIEFATLQIARDERLESSSCKTGFQSMHKMDKKWDVDEDVSAVGWSIAARQGATNWHLSPDSPC